MFMTSLNVLEEKLLNRLKRLFVLLKKQGMEYLPKKVYFYVIICKEDDYDQKLYEQC